MFNPGEKVVCIESIAYSGYEKVDKGNVYTVELYHDGNVFLYETGETIAWNSHRFRRYNPTDIFKKRLGIYS